jgi:hypothetical protein
MEFFPGNLVKYFSIFFCETVIIFPATFSIMALAKKSRKKSKPLSPEILPELLASALRENRDFIVTFETRPGDESKRDVHVLTGPLITSCILGNLQRRASLYEDDGATMMTGEWPGM